MNKWYWIVPAGFGLFTLLYGILAEQQCPKLFCEGQDCYFSCNCGTGYSICECFFTDIYHNCVMSVFIPAIVFNSICFLTTLVYCLVIVIKNNLNSKKAQIQQIVTDMKNLTVVTNVSNVDGIQNIQDHEVVNEELELEKEIRLLEKQKRIAELKKEIKDIELGELSTSKNIMANTK
ncbi:308_t:CDS:1, partial [Dentiscutata heterogama]